MADQGKTRSQFEAEIVARAWEDDAYRQRLLKDPKSVFEEAVVKIGGKRLPDDFKLTVLEETAKNVYLVLPLKPQAVDAKLTDDQLQGAAGGVRFVPQIYIY